MRDYQRKINNKYILPPAVYNQTLWIIRDYRRMAEELDDILTSSPAPADGMPRSGKISDETFSKVNKRSPMLKKVQAIDAAIESIPEEYQKGVWNNIVHNKAFPKDADRTTYARYKTKFIYRVATSLGLA